MSWGFILFKLPEYGTPSKTISGALSAFIEPNPLIRIIGSSPGCPLDWIILNPDANPSRPWIGFANVAFSICLASITLIDPVKEALDCEPYATTTTSSSELESSCKVTFIMLLLPTVFSEVLYPR